MRAHRRVVLVALGVLVGGACRGGGSEAPATSSTPVPVGPVAVDTVRDGLLTACVGAVGAPYVFEEDGQVAGIEADLVRALGGRLALTAAFVDVPTADAGYAALGRGECDVAAAATVAGSPLPDGVRFLPPHLEVEPALLVRAADQESITDLAALAGATVGVVTGTAGAAYVRDNAGGATIREFAEAPAALAALTGEEVGAVVHDFPVVAHHATTTGATAVSATFEVPDAPGLALAVADDDATLVGALEGALAQVTADDTFPGILRRYLGVAPPPR